MTPEQKNAFLASNVLHREAEIEAYQINIDNYSLMLAALPDGEWPEGLKQYAGTSVENLPDDMSEDTVQTISDYQYRDRLRKLLRSERMEQGKSQRVLNALIAQIPEDKRALVLEEAAAHQST